MLYRDLRHFRDVMYSNIWPTDHLLSAFHSSMDKKYFESVASLATDVKSKEGLNVKYCGTGKDISVNCNWAGESKFTGSFSLEPATVKIGTSPISVKICPNVKALGGSLTIDPLDEGAFEFSMSRQFLSMGWDYKFSSKDAKSVLTVKPQGVYKGAKCSGEIQLQKDVKCPPFKTCVEYKGITWRTNFESGKGPQFKTAAFWSTPCNCSVFGVGAHFSELGKPSDLFLMARGTMKGVTLATITNVLKDGVRDFSCQVRCEYEKKIDCKTVKVAAVACRDQSGKLTMTEGCHYECSKCHCNVDASLNNEKRSLVVAMKNEGPNWFFLPKFEMTSTLTFEGLALSKEALTPKLGLDLSVKE